MLGYGDVTFPFISCALARVQSPAVRAVAVPCVRGASRATNVLSGRAESGREAGAGSAIRLVLCVLRSLRFRVLLAKGPMLTRPN